jgi:hypothetical protein
VVRGKDKSKENVAKKASWYSQKAKWTVGRNSFLNTEVMLKVWN